MSTPRLDALARTILVELAKADAAVRGFPEPRQGPEFVEAQRIWSSTYARAIALGGQIEPEIA